MTASRSAFSWDLHGTDDPTIAPTPAPVGFSYRNIATGELYQKTGPGDLDWTIVSLGAAPTAITLPNGEAVPMIPGQPVTSLGDSCRFANASLDARSTVIGLVAIGAAQTLPVTIIPLGPIELSTALWDAVTGDVGGLMSDATYYLDTANGRMTTTPPTASGVYLVEIGRGITPSIMSITPTRPTLL